MNNSRLIYFIILLISVGCKRGDKLSKEECENFQVSGTFYKGEKLTVKFNSKIIHEDFFEDKTWSVLHRFCMDYTDTFQVDLRVVKGNRVILDTSMVGLSKNGYYLLRLPKGNPREELLDKVRKDEDLYVSIPPESLSRVAILEPGLIITD